MFWQNYCLKLFSMNLRKSFIRRFARNVLIKHLLCLYCNHRFSLVKFASFKSFRIKQTYFGVLADRINSSNLPNVLTSNTDSCVSCGLWAGYQNRSIVGSGLQKAPTLILSWSGYTIKMFSHVAQPLCFNFTYWKKVKLMYCVKVNRPLHSGEKHNWVCVVKFTSIKGLYADSSSQNH